MAKQIDTRSVLLGAALDLIWSHNYGSVSVDDICKKAAAQKGSFYHYFESKQQLAIMALEFAWDALRPDLDRVFSSQYAALERLRLYSEFSLAVQEAEFKRFGFVVGCPFTSVGSERCAEDDGLTKKAWEILQRLQKYFFVAVRDACQEGSLVVPNHAQAASEIFSHYLGATAIARLSGSLEPLSGLYDRWIRILQAQRGDGPRRSPQGQQVLAAQGVSVD